MMSNGQSLWDGPTLSITSEAVGKKIRVRVTGKRPGYATVVRYSEFTAIVRR